MSSALDDGGPAFPTDANLHHSSGMSLREYYAAHAPITLHDARMVFGICAETQGWEDANRSAVFAVLSLMRFEYADAMIAEGSK